MASYPTPAPRLSSLTSRHSRTHFSPVVALTRRCGRSHLSSLSHSLFSRRSRTHCSLVTLSPLDASPALASPAAEAEGTSI
ncbi:uncharacterized protein DS421_2g56680 [Arachis hypogaea]|nr:uncharacterized protein DS421_2g56680 [Arachis hypogaea]